MLMYKYAKKNIFVTNKIHDQNFLINYRQILQIIKIFLS